MSSLHASEFHSSAGSSGKQVTHHAGKVLKHGVSPREKTPDAPHAITGWFNAVARQEHPARTGNFSLGDICANKLRNMEMDTELGVRLHRAQRAIFVLTLGLALMVLAVDAQPISKSAPAPSPQHMVMRMSRR